MSRTFVSSRSILVTPDLPTGGYIERSIKDIALTRGTKRFGRGNFVAACLRSIAECGLNFAGCHGEIAVAARLADVIRRGLNSVATAASTKGEQSNG